MEPCVELLKRVLKGYLISPPLKLKKEKYLIIKGPFVIVYLLEGGETLSISFIVFHCDFIFFRFSSFQKVFLFCFFFFFF